jgi:hypothetical protein
MSGMQRARIGVRGSLQFLGGFFQWLSVVLAGRFFIRCYSSRGTDFFGIDDSWCGSRPI